MQKKIFIKTLGCQMNEYDSNRILDLTKQINYESTNNLWEADCYILNTCHIREKATDKVYHDIGRLKKEFRNKLKPIVLIAGCVAQAEGEILLKREKYIDAVIGPQSYHQIKDMILKLEKKTKSINFTEFDVIEKFDSLNSIKNSDNKISSFLTIQEGCDKFCKFCVVPYTRGTEFSRSIKEILLEANQLVKNGTKEITLLGQNVNAYNFEKTKLSDLILELSKISDLKRIRYTTSHPVDFTEDLIEVHKNCKKLMPIIHLPVQSGSNKILASMNRKHTIEDYLNILEKLKKKKPDIKFSSDFIIGYPGESKSDFEATMKLMNDVKFINSYSFIYSARPGTPAFNLKKIDQEDTKTRLIQFQKLADKIKIDYRKNLVNKITSTLFENKIKNEDKYFGRDKYSNSVIVQSDENLIGKIKDVKILKVNHNTLFGETILSTNQKNYAA
ncbi:tRNA (N6-isopentenyl adenosine(37)-C2)-methylthiotransferase MiaB [Candidatus Pelagibacter bacterium]|nr:tRNA (N6-isopentenyl adenosine(37)-C2)-methylthiotransferase MiaB [Candidatus Pelagibacter bacterium]